MVVRKSFNERYAEPSYYIIKQAFPDLTSTDYKAGYVLAKQVFRGKCLGEEKRINSGYKPDWQLISKADEEKYLSNKLAYEPLEAPTTADMPPLLAKFYMDRLSRDGVEVKPEDTKLYLRVNRGVHNRAQQSQVDELTESLPSEERIQPKTWAERQMLKRYKRKGVSRPSL
ncbi:MRPS34 [Bugula neritina]|uniref:MRPS34 n=1 Tax=Bugula neritina TaxID=10212 RepID=A0A7J7KDS8_BUGNE|nr:MRPS34 [Bugula neritina]